MRLFIISILILQSLFSRAQQGYKNVQPGDSAMIKHGHIHTSDEIRTVDKFGRVEMYTRDGLMYQWNYKPVPMGVYCDTAITAVDGQANSPLRYIRISVFVDRKMVFATMFIAMHKWVWSVYVDTASLNRIGGAERSVATGAKSGK